MNGQIHVYFGDGKGKTSSANGLAVRAIGAGMKVWIGRFCKGRDTSEDSLFVKLGDSVEVHHFGKDSFVTKVDDEDVRLASEGFFSAIEAIESKKFGLVILDEILWALELGLIRETHLVEFLSDKKSPTEIVLTGRHVSPSVLKIADLATEMKEISHYWHKGLAARKGIEF